MLLITEVVSFLFNLTKQIFASLCHFVATWVSRLNCIQSFIFNREKRSINLRLYLTSLCLVIVHGLHRTQVITQQVLNETKPRLSIAITHEAITLRTKSKHRLVQNLLANLHAKFEAFMAIDKKNSSIFSADMYR